MLDMAIWIRYDNCINKGTNVCFFNKGGNRMANFAVSASDEIIAHGRELMAQMAQPGEKQGDTLERMFRIVAEHKDGETMKQAGVDVQALDASLSNIRNMFLAAATSKEQIVAIKDNMIAEVKNLKDQMEKDLREKLAAADTEKKAAEEQAVAAAKEAALAIKDAQAAKEQAETANRLVSEKDLTIATLADKLSAAEAKIKGYDDLMQKEAAAQDKIRELQTQVERITSDAQKDTALAVANAVAEKEREFATQLRAADKENARLQARIEILEEQLQAAVNK